MRSIPAAGPLTTAILEVCLRFVHLPHQGGAKTYVSSAMLVMRHGLQCLQ